MFITFEGGEGTGKSKQSQLLFKYLTSIGKDAILTREPGGTPVSENIRSLLLTGDAEKLEPLSEALLFLAARSDHWLRKIKPALDLGKIVVCDRFQDSTIVYQGICKGINISVLNLIFTEFTGGELPKRTYLIDLDPKIGLSRSFSRENHRLPVAEKPDKEIRFEKMNIKFHEKVREGFLKLAREEPQRFLIIDGSCSIQEIHERIIIDIKNFL